MRKESLVRLEDDGEQKEFKIRQMSASRGERFFFKLLLLLGGDMEVSKLTDPYALLSALADKPFERVEELLDDMLSCISRVNGGVETQLTPENVDAFVSSPITLFKLRAEVVKANNFFQNGALTPSDASSDASVHIARRG
jgi:hypothetical protein